MSRCPAEIHAHIDGECLGVINRCIKEMGHHMRGWHKTPDGSVRWDYDHRLSPPHEDVKGRGRVYTEGFELGRVR